jgi:exopolyphosphatase / guanosine-5'-triphosphate,3'-diphosphate pyrophosphatase
MTNGKHIIAAIEIGSTGLRMIVAETAENGTWRILDRAGRPVSLGRDVFTTGIISRDSMLEALRILNGFKELLKGWKIPDHQIKVIATSALREARNRDTFVDRVALHTGFRINIVEGIEENHLMYLAVQDAIRDLKPQTIRTNSIIIEVGGGSTEIMLLHRGKMVAAHSLRIGTIRIYQQVAAALGSSKYLLRFLQENVRTTIDMLSSEMLLQSVRFFIAIGSDARLVAQRVGREESELYSVIDKEAFERFIEEYRGLSVDDLVSRLRIPYNEAETLMPGLLVYRLFLNGTSAEQLIVPNVSIREGLLISMVGGPDLEVQEEFYSQVIASAVSLGRKYHFDEPHALHVAHLALKLFDDLKVEHGLDRHARLLLEVASILHDIGRYVRTSGHQKHSQYIVLNSEIFGLHRDDLTIVANIARYHRKSLPSSAHMTFTSLPREDRIIVLKLSALLRVADALDRGHSQRVADFTIEKREDTVILHSPGFHDLTLEKMGLADKANLFEEVFGYKVILS